MLNKSIPMYAIELRSALHAGRLYQEQFLLESRMHDENGTPLSEESASSFPYSSASQTMTDASKSTRTSRSTGSGSIDITLPVLRTWLNHSTPFLTQGEIFDLAGIRSGSRQAKLKKILIGKGLIREHPLQKSKNHLLVWEPTCEAYDLAGVSMPKLRSKGGWLHKFAAFRISRWANVQGYLVDVEFLLPNGKAVDLILRRAKETVFVEVAISRPFKKEISNILLDTEVGLRFDRLIIAVANSKVKKSIEKLLQNDPRVNIGQHKIEVQLIGRFVEIRHSSSEKGV